MDDPQKPEEDASQSNGDAKQTRKANHQAEAPQSGYKAKNYAEKCKQLALKYTWHLLGKVVVWLDGHNGLVTAVSTVSIAVLTYFVAVYANGQLGVFRNQLEEMKSTGAQTDQLIAETKKSAEAAKQSADLAYEIERGRIQIQNVVFSSDDPPAVSYEIVNLGRTATTLILSRTKVERIQLPLAAEAVPWLQDFRWPFGHESFGGKVLEAKNVISRKTGPSVLNQPPPQGRSAWYFRGTMTYQDIFGKEYKRVFCFRSNGLTCEEVGRLMTAQGHYNYEKQQPSGSERTDWPI